jgi:ATP-binding cassette, subfamily B, bacterial
LEGPKNSNNLSTIKLIVFLNFPAILIFMGHFPNNLQPDSLDCGPVCLKNIAQFYGKQIPLSIIREMTYLNREGVSLVALSDAAETLGFRTTGGKIHLSALEQVMLPAILHWDQNHFVVLYQIKKKRKETILKIANPASGLETFSASEFMDHWAFSSVQGQPGGIILLLEPTPGFFKTGSPRREKKGFGFLTSYLKPYKKLIIQVIIGFLTGTLISLMFPFLTQTIIDVGITSHDLNFIVLVLIAQLVLIISQTAVEFIRSWILLHIGARVSISLISDYLIHLMQLPIRFFDTRLNGDLRQRIEDNNRIHSFLTTDLINMSFGVFLFVIYSIVLLFYSWKILAVFLLGSGTYGFWIFLFMKKRKELDDKRFEAKAANQSNLFQMITGMQEIKLNNCEKQKRWEWERIQIKLFKVSAKALILHQNQMTGSVLINQVKNFVIIFLAAKSVTEGEMTLGMLVAVEFIIGQLNAPIQQFVSFISAAQDARMSLERLSEIREQLREDSSGTGTINILPDKKDIFIDNVTFQYEGPRSPKVIDAISLRIQANSITAIVGPSGSGKTTLVKLLLGFYSPVDGKIMVGNDPLEHYSKKLWRDQCGAVMQDGFIFSDTIAGNIAVGDDTPDQQRLIQSVSIANIREFIDSLPLGYNTKIGQDGVGLSQGQKQRILIARVIYKNPAFLILDEATNALDAGNESVILKNLNAVYKGKTVVVIAHRLSTVKEADCIVVVENGKIVESGTHRELTLKKGAYYHLVKNQLELGQE